MKKNIAITAIILFLSNSLYSSNPSYLFSAKDSLVCSKDIKVSFIQTTQKTYDATYSDIEIVFDGVFVNYPFEQLGYIEVSGNDSTDLNEIIECLQSTASLKGADAVINIKRQNTKDRTTFSGILIKHINDDGSDDTSSAEQADSLVNDSEIELVFDGVYVNYPFEQLGYTEISGSDSTDLNEIIEGLKSTALIKGSDAVIDIKRQNIKDKTTFSGILIKHVYDESYAELPFVAEPNSGVFFGIFSVAIAATIYIVSKY